MSLSPYWIESESRYLTLAEVEEMFKQEQPKIHANMREHIGRTMSTDAYYQQFARQNTTLLSSPVFWRTLNLVAYHIEQSRMAAIRSN